MTLEMRIEQLNDLTQRSPEIHLGFAGLGNIRLRWPVESGSRSLELGTGFTKLRTSCIDCYGGSLPVSVDYRHSRFGNPDQIVNGCFNGTSASSIDTHGAACYHRNI